MNKYLEKLAARRFVRELFNDARKYGVGKGLKDNVLKHELKARTPTSKNEMPFFTRAKTRE